MMRRIWADVSAAFNMIGVVDVTDQDTHHVVNVEFHDKSADRRGYHFQDHNRFHLAAVGKRNRLSLQVLHVSPY